MSARGFITRIVRVNGEERQRSTVPCEHGEIERIEIPVVTINPPLLQNAKIELELQFDPPLVPKDTP